MGDRRTKTNPKADLSVLLQPAPYPRQTYRDQHDSNPVSVVVPAKQTPNLRYVAAHAEQETESPDGGKFHAIAAVNKDVSKNNTGASFDNGTSRQLTAPVQNNVNDLSQSLEFNQFNAPVQNKVSDVSQLLDFNYQDKVPVQSKVSDVSQLPDFNYGVKVPVQSKVSNVSWLLDFNCGDKVPVQSKVSDVSHPLDFNYQDKVPIQNKVSDVSLPLDFNYQDKVPVQSKVSNVSHPLDFNYQVEAPVQSKVSDVSQPLDFNYQDKVPVQSRVSNVSQLLDFNYQVEAPVQSKVSDVSQLPDFNYGVKVPVQSKVSDVSQLLDFNYQVEAPVQSKVSNVSLPLDFNYGVKAPVQSKVGDVSQFPDFNYGVKAPVQSKVGDVSQFPDFNYGVKVPVQSKVSDVSQLLDFNYQDNVPVQSKVSDVSHPQPLMDMHLMGFNEIDTPVQGEACDLPQESANIDGKKSARSRNRRKRKNKQSNVKINQNESLDKSNSDEIKPGVGISSAPNEDHPGTGENSRARKLYEPKIIIVSGVANTTTKDGLWNYMELMSGEGVETVEFLEKGKAVVHLRRDPDFGKLKNKIRGRKLDGIQPNVERLGVCKRILVSGLPPKVTKDSVMLYFKNVRRSNGGNVVDVTLLKDTHSAVVTFQKSEVVSKVIAKSHSLENKKLTVKKYYPQTDAQVTSERCGTSNDDKPKADDSTHVPVKSKVHDKRLKTSVKVDPDIMEFIMLGNHRKELEDKLDTLNAEIEWNNGSNTATIWKKADSGYVKKWPKRCRDVLVEFLNRFEKVFFLLDETLRIAVNEALPRLAETISPEKALRKQVDEKLLVVCLEEESEKVTQSVNEFIEIIQKEEVRKTYQKETIKNVRHNHLLLLKHIKYAEKMKDEHAELEVILDVDKHEIYLEGPREQFADAKIKYVQTKDEISEQKLVLPSYIINILVSESGKKRIQENMALGDISAIVLPREEDSVNVIAENFREYRRARDCICDAMREAKISFPLGHNFIFKKKEWTQISGELNSRELINVSISYTEHLIALRGVSEIVDESEKKVKEYIESQRIKELQRPVSQIVARFFKQNLSREVEGLTAQLKDSQVSVEIKETDGIILYRGTESGLQECKRFLDNLCRSISEKEKEFSSPGVNQLLFGETGQRYIKSIEVEKRVVIETRKEQKVNVKETSRVEVESLREELERETRRELLVTETRRKSTSATKSAAPPLPGSTYDLCNFSTREGVRVSWKYGNIADQTADVLVNSAHSDLSNPTACGRALNKVGGSSYIQACANYTSTLHAEAVACTTGGNLACSFVLHAVCCRWDNHQGKAETLLRNLVKEILRESNRRGAKSLAMPAIGTGQHKFPEDVVFRTLREECQYFSASQGSPTLKDIRIIVFANGPIAKQAPRPRPRAPLRSSFLFLTASRAPTKEPGNEVGQSPASTGSRLVSYGPVRVSLVEGDITEQPVDAIINVLPKDRQLSNGGGVCKSILRKGGQTIQQQLNSCSELSPGFVVQTMAGSIQNARAILHFVPHSKDIANLKASIVACLNEARSLSLSSVAVSAIGTGPFGVSPKDSAKMILRAAEKFSSLSYPLNIKIVVFQKQMVHEFESVMQEKSTKNIVAAPLKPILRTSSRYTSAQDHSSSSQSSRTSRFIPLNTGETKQTVKLHFVGRSVQQIDSSIDEVSKFVNDNTKKKEIEHEKVFDVFSKHWSDVEQLTRDFDVIITCNTPSVACIEGLVANVADCKEKLSQLVNKYVEEERQRKHLDYISNNVQWYYSQGGQSVKYDRELNGQIEMAHMENKEILQFMKSGYQYKIDFTEMTEKNSRSGQVERIARKRLGETGSDVSLPADWDPQPPGQVVHLVSLSQWSSEYERVLIHFISKGGTSRQIIKIERIQNPGLYKAYLAKKQSMNGEENEMQLFHGTNADNTQSINANNFSRSFAGINGVKFGNGVYFARDASYSMGYAQRGSSNYSQMYVARVLVGKYATGGAGMKAPPSRNDPANPGVLYDSVVDNIHNPSIFVIFLDHQCYPEYLITFL